jgi:hypothetical protein
MLSGIGSQNWVNCGSVCVKFCCFFEKENILEKRGQSMEIWRDLTKVISILY